MFLLSPPKLLIVLVVALVVLGPDKIPGAARQVGAFWGEFKAFRQKLSSEVRDTFPDLPSTEVITRAVHSPLTFLDSLVAEAGPDGTGSPDGVEATAVVVDGTVAGVPAGTGPTGAGPYVLGVEPGRPGVPATVPDDPTMN